MAQQIIEQWRLAVLRVQLDLTERTPAVATESVTYPERNPHTLWKQRHPLAEFGLEVSSGPPHELRVPDHLRDRIARSLETDLEGEASLWLRLTPPYGFLGAVPWEESLLTVTDVPLLRVPDRLPAATDPGRAWTIAIAVSAAAGSTWAAPYVTSLVHELANAVSDDFEVDVFVDGGTASQLRSRDWPRRKSVHLHRPEVAEAVSVNRTERGVPQFRRRRRGVLVGSAATGRVWADWIAEGLGRRAVRALHVVLDAVWDDDRPILALSPDPKKPTDQKTCTYVSADDVRMLADVVGAATLSFGSPPTSPAEAAMRMVADSTGQQRPGPTIYSSLRLDSNGAALARLHGFIAAQSRQAQIPRHPSLFAYLQPEHVQASLRDDSTDDSPMYPDVGLSPGDPLSSAVLPEGYDVSQDADLTDYYAESGTVPSWVATSERYIGSELAELTRSAAAPPTTSFKDAYDRGAAEALAELHQLVAEHARLT